MSRDSNAEPAARMTIRVPPLEEQRRIASILEALDAAIDSTEQGAQHLQQLQGALTDTERREWGDACVHDGRAHLDALRELRTRLMSSYFSLTADEDAEADGSLLGQTPRLLASMVDPSRQ